ncbi:hypothetical protein KFK09_009527 [Dendrobium nobile]|uniref:Uncharacterized protein n=1 Tax=Dendrobium nobile TaxID=94219 RepID=A0A8T3BLN9_DENNO|nr:hypothetical protein KFK09_009527 [Dendrobium nobile]
MADAVTASFGLSCGYLMFLLPWTMMWSIYLNPLDGLWETRGFDGFSEDMKWTFFLSPGGVLILLFYSCYFRIFLSSRF